MSIVVWIVCEVEHYCLDCQRSCASPRTAGVSSMHLLYQHRQYWHGVGRMHLDSSRCCLLRWARDSPNGRGSRLRQSAAPGSWLPTVQQPPGIATDPRGQPQSSRSGSMPGQNLKVSERLWTDLTGRKYCKCLLHSPALSRQVVAAIAALL